jgi:hypothetical protein
MSTAEVALAGTVFLHLGITLVHGFTHSRAEVVLPPASMAFVFGVILIGPVLGWSLQRLALPRGGAWIAAATLGGARRSASPPRCW